MEDFEIFKKDLEVSESLPRDPCTTLDCCKPVYNVVQKLQGELNCGISEGEYCLDTQEETKRVERKQGIKNMDQEPTYCKKNRRLKSTNKESKVDAEGRLEDTKDTEFQAYDPTVADFDRQDFATRCRFKDTKEFKMLEMLRKAELLCQKKKRQTINRKIVELEEDLDKFVNGASDETLAIEDYHALREKLDCLPKEIRKQSKCKVLITTIEKDTCFSRSKMFKTKSSDERIDESRKLKLKRIRKKREEFAALTYRMGTRDQETARDAADQQTAKQTHHEVVTRWLIENGNEKVIDILVGGQMHQNVVLKRPGSEIRVCDGTGYLSQPCIVYGPTETDNHTLESTKRRSSWHDFSSTFEFLIENQGMSTSPNASPFGERKSLKSYGRGSSRFPRPESTPSPNSSDGDDFRSMAMRLTRTAGASAQLLDPSARLAAQKKSEAEEKLKLQKQIEAVKTKMKTVETVEKTCMSYDTTKVKSQIESELKAVEDFVEEGPDEEAGEYKEWLEEVMAQGWNEEVKELVSERKKVSKRNLIRARKRSIVKRYSIIVPEVSDEYPLSPDEDDFTEEEKLRREVEERLQGIDMDQDIEEVSRNRHWSAEIQELVVSKKMINHHNLMNARKRNIVKSLQEKYPGCTYELNLEPDELTECEIERMKLDKHICDTRVLLNENEDISSIINFLMEKWKFNVKQLEDDKKKVNKKNVFNHLVRSLVKESQELFPDLEYFIDLEEDELTDEEQKKRNFQNKLNRINNEFGDKSCDEIADINEEAVSHLNRKDWLISKNNLIRILKKFALIQVYGEGDENMMQHHEVTDASFVLSDRRLAHIFVDEKMVVVDKELDQKAELDINFPDEIAELRAIQAKLNAENVRLLCLKSAHKEVLEKFPKCGLEIPIISLEISEIGLAFKELMQEFSALDSLLTDICDEEFRADGQWAKERSYLNDNSMKITPENGVRRKKEQLYNSFKVRFPNAEYEETFEYDEFTAAEIEAIRLKEMDDLYQKVCQSLEQEIKDAKMSLDRAYKRSGIDHNELGDHLDEFEWKEETAQLVKMGIPLKRKPLFELKARNIVDRYQKRYNEFTFEPFLSTPHDYDSDFEYENTGDTGCFTCDLKAQTSFFPGSLSDENHAIENHVSLEDFEDQIIAISIDSDTDVSVSVSPSENESVDPIPSYFSPPVEEITNGIAMDINGEHSHDEALRPDALLPQATDINGGDECDGVECDSSSLIRSRHNSSPPFSPGKTTEESTENANHPFTALSNGVKTVGDSAYGSRSSLKSDNSSDQETSSDSKISNENCVPKCQNNIPVDCSKEENDTSMDIRSESIGSDNVFEPNLPKPINSHESADGTVTDTLKETALSENNGGIESSAAEDSLLSHKTPTDAPTNFDLLDKTPTKIQHHSTKSSASSEKAVQPSEPKTKRIPKRKKTSGSGTSIENQTPVKRQEEHNRNSNLLEPKKSIENGKPLSNDNDTQNVENTTINELPNQPPSPAVKEAKKGPIRHSTSSEMPNFDHIKSNYRMEKTNPLLDRKKYVKVPTLDDNIVKTKPLLEGLLPKKFYDQTLSFDLEGTLASSTQPPSHPKKGRSSSEINSPAAPTTGHVYWDLMKERKSEREEEGTMVADLDLAIIDKEHVTVVSSQILDAGRGNGQPAGNTKCVRAIVSRCSCKTPFQLDRVGDGKYKLPHTSQIFFVRILRNHVMVRVGGGWDTLDHFIAKHDPCRTKFRQIAGGSHHEPATCGVSPSTPCQVPVDEISHTSSPSPAPTTATSVTPSRRSVSRPSPSTTPSSGSGNRSSPRPPKESSSNAPSTPTRRSVAGTPPTGAPSSRRASANTLSAPVKKSSSGNNTRSPSPRVSTGQSPASSSKSKGTPRPTEGNAKLPQPRKRRTSTQTKTRSAL